MSAPSGQQAAAARGSGGRHRGAARPDVRRILHLGGRTLGALLSAAVFLASGWGWYNFADLRAHAHLVDVQGLGGDVTTGPSGATQQVTGDAQNILIVGIDSRAGLTAKERRYLKVGNDTTTSTDTIMLVHVPADGSRATLISIPRDSWVQIPGHPDAKINAAYADGYYYGGAHGAEAQETAGINTLVATVKQLTGVPIDHYVQVGFAGFVDIVDAIGTVPVTLCESVDDTHAYNVAHGQSGGSGFKMSAGHHDLTPQQALEFVRQRHNIPGPVSDDLGRELRQRYFLSAAFKKILSAGTLLNPFKLRKLVKAVDDAFTMDRHFDFLSLAEQMVNLTAGNITGRSIPTDGSYLVGDPAQDALRVDPAKVQRAVRAAFYGGDSQHTATSGHHGSGASHGLTRPGEQNCVH